MTPGQATMAMNDVGVVVIGRNEGQRLRRCLESLAGRAGPVVYVDSGSSDASVALAKSLGVQVVELDMAKPFTMARGRNTGFRRLMEIGPNTQLVQFVDGDCEVVDGWLTEAARVMRARTDVGSMCGWRREQNPQVSIYNRITDIEWGGPTGEIDFCGGDVLTRVSAFEQAGGYNEAMIAGEDPEICVRLRRCGWKLLRLDRDMTRHDAAMTSWRQWWRRAVRAGHAFAEQAALHGKPPERCCVKQTRSNWFWGLLLPLAAIAGAWPTHGSSMLLLLGYPIWAGRVAWRMLRLGRRSDAWSYGVFCMIAKFPHVIGQMWYWWHRLRRRRAGLIEYK